MKNKHASMITCYLLPKAGQLPQNITFESSIADQDKKQLRQVCLTFHAIDPSLYSDDLDCLYNVQVPGIAEQLHVRMKSADKHEFWIQLPEDQLKRAEWFRN